MVSGCWGLHAINIFRAWPSLGSFGVLFVSPASELLLYASCRMCVIESRLSLPSEQRAKIFWYEVSIQDVKRAAVALQTSFEKHSGLDDQRTFKDIYLGLGTVKCQNSTVCQQSGDSSHAEGVGEGGTLLLLQRIHGRAPSHFSAMVVVVS